MDKTHVSYFIKLLNTQLFMNRLIYVVAHYFIKIFYATLIKILIHTIVKLSGNNHVRYYNYS